MASEFMDAEYIPVNLDNIIDHKGESKLTYDLDLFLDGFNCGTYWAGFATALFNSGLEEDTVMTLLQKAIEEKNVY